MFAYQKIVFILILFGFCQISAINPNQYCDLEKYCTVDGLGTTNLHIGCPKNNVSSKSNYKVLKLKHDEKTYIINELNQFRSDVALGEIYAKNISSSTFSYMKKLKWNLELEHLLQLMITKYSNKEFFCMSTEVDHKPIQMVISINRPQPFGLMKVCSTAIDELKIKALQSFSLAKRNEIINLSQLYHPETWSFACATGEVNSALKINNKDILIRCAFYGQKFRKLNDDFQFGEVCSRCANEGCSDLFPGLCGRDFYRKQGKKGIRGQPGWTGGPGRSGNEGERGEEGDTGVPGINGMFGDKGAKGIKGNTGSEGFIVKGNKGFPGITANSKYCKGEPGLNGLTEHNGRNGPRGADGQTGDKGEPASQTKGEKGDPGLSIKGTEGDGGDEGGLGLDGPDGEPGTLGENGDGVFNMNPRFMGIDDCLVCTPGLQGLPGLAGPQGPPGADIDDEPEQRYVTTSAPPKFF